MRKPVTLFLTLFLLCSPLLADPPTVAIPATAKGDVGSPIRVTATSTGKDVQWVSLDVGLFVFPAELLKDSKTAVVWATTSGTYRLLAYTGTADGPSLPAFCAVTIGAPAPPIPVPPTPVPPGPGPGPAPIPTAGLRVLIVYESSELGKLPKGQADVLSSGELRSYLNAKCVVGSDGKTKEWRVLDKDADMTSESSLWQDAMKLPRAQVPWIVVSTGTNGFAGPLPATIADTMALLKKFGG